MTTLDLGTPYLHATVANRVLKVRIDRTDRRNAMTLDMYRGLKQAAIVADGDAELDAICLTGTGDWFCVGGDMSGRAADPRARLGPPAGFAWAKACRAPGGRSKR